jgi:hypothetical protein
MKLLSAIYVTCILFIASESFRTLSSLQTWNKANSLSGSRNEFHLNLFNLGKKTDSPASNEVKAKILSKYKQEPGKLEKISRSQNRDYEAEAKARAPKPQEIKDKQVQSFNFGKTNEFPNLFKGNFIFEDGSAYYGSIFRDDNAIITWLYDNRLMTTSACYHITTFNLAFRY